MHTRRTNQRQLSVPAPPPVETRPQTTQVRQTGQSRHPRHAAPDGESFDLAAISGSEDEEEDLEEDQRPTQPPIGTDTAVPENDGGINDPNVILTRNSKNKALDIHFFFNKLTNVYQCKVCKRAHDAEPRSWDPEMRYEYSRKSSTTTLRPHIEKYHLRAYLDEQRAQGWNILLPGLVSQARSQATSETHSQNEGDRDMFDEETFQRYLINFIVANDQALNIIECREFRDLLLLLRKELKETMIPHRTRLRELIIQSWKRYFQTLKQDLSNAVGRVSFTMDAWSDHNRRSYLAITAHWIGRIGGTTSLQPKAALIAFHRLLGNHEGKSVGKVVVGLLDRAGVTVKAGHFTLDNAGNNGTAMEEIGRSLRAREIEFDSQDRKVMCFPHIVNLSSGRVIEGLTKVLEDVPEDWEPPPLTHTKQSYADAVARDPIALGRAVVRAIRASGTRREAFDDVIETGNAKNWFKDGKKTIRVKPLQLLRDVSTRWDSVYYMINRLREMRPAVDYFLALPNHSDLAKYRITPQEWNVLQDFEIILSVPHTVQQIMSGEGTPILSGAIPAFEMFMTKWEKLGNEHPHLKPFIKPGLDWAYLYYNRMDRTTAYIVAMLLNPSLRMTWIQKHWENEFATDAETSVKQLMIEYRERAAASEEQPPPSPSPSSGANLPSYTLAAKYGLSDDMDVGDPDANEQTVEQEYQAYITAPLSPKTTDIIKFWEINSTVFPTLFAMAMDYLPIQASAVSCERVFSSSAETDTKKRNRINPLLMESLQMLKFHLKKAHLNFTEGYLLSEKQAEKELIEDAPEEDMLGKLLSENYQDALDRIMRSIDDYE